VVLEVLATRPGHPVAPDRTATSTQGYALTLPADEIDSMQFERLVTRGRELLTLGEVDRAAYLLTQGLLHVRWANGNTTRSPERISAVEPPSTDADGVMTACLSYVYEGLPAKLGLVRGTRHQRLRQEPGGLTSYDTVEEFSGPLVRFAGPGRVTEGFRRHAAGLKLRAEELARG
jgi:hypothetical protein